MSYDYKKIRSQSVTSNSATLSVFVSDITIDYDSSGFSATFQENETGTFYTAKLNPSATDVLYALNARLMNFVRSEPSPVMVTLLPDDSTGYTILGLY